LIFLAPCQHLCTPAEIHLTVMAAGRNFNVAPTF
jgi:hypothetical protein